MFCGSMVALLTPMLDDKVDVAQLKKLVEFHIQAGTQALIAAGTTGESGTLTTEEKRLVIKTVIDASADRVPVIAGTAANSTAACIELTDMAMHLGAYAALIMTPAYIKPTQEGLFLHYAHIAQAVPMPIIMYNVPSRTGCDLLPETVQRLAQISNIIGIKDATGDDARLQAILSRCGESLDVYSGDDASAGRWMLAGAKGVISVTANIAPKKMAQMSHFALTHQEQAYLAINDELKDLHHMMFVQTNPIPAKWAACRMGLMSEEIRLPLTPLSVEHHAPMEKVLHQLHLL